MSQQVDLKWFLFKHHNLYNASTEFGRREGVRAILKMLLDGPGNIATEAILALSQVDMFPFAEPLSADLWVSNRLENYKRYGEQLAECDGGCGAGCDDGAGRAAASTDASASASADTSSLLSQWACLCKRLRGGRKNSSAAAGRAVFK